MSEGEMTQSVRDIILSSHAGKWIRSEHLHFSSIRRGVYGSLTTMGEVKSSSMVGCYGDVIQ